MYHREIDLAAKTPKQDNNEEDYDVHAQPQEPVLPHEEQTQLDELKNRLHLRLLETAEEFKRHVTKVRNDFLTS